jgi:hypothetical protein
MSRKDWIDADEGTPVVEAFTDKQLIKCCKLRNDRSIRKVGGRREDEEPKYCTQKQASWFILKYMEFAESSSTYAVAEIMNLHIIHNV